MENIYRALLVGAILQTLNSQMSPFDPRRIDFQNNFQNTFFRSLGNRDNGDFRLNRNDDPMRQLTNQNRPLTNGFGQIQFSSFARRNGDDLPVRQRSFNGFGQIRNEDEGGFRRSPTTTQNEDIPRTRSTAGSQFSRDPGPNNDWSTMIGEIPGSEGPASESTSNIGDAGEANTRAQTFPMVRSNVPQDDPIVQTRSSPSMRVGNTSPTGLRNQDDPTKSLSSGPRVTSTSRTDPNTGRTSWSWSWQSGPVSGPTSGFGSFPSMPGASFSNFGSSPGSTSNVQPTSPSSSSTSGQFGQTTVNGSPFSTLNSRPFNNGGIVVTDSRRQPTSGSPTSGSTPVTWPGTSVPSTASSTVVVTQPTLSCTAEFQKMTGHTLCKTDDPRTQFSGVSASDKRMITQLHNELRGGVQPPAEDLQVLKWDDRLAAVASKWAKQCTLGHDTERNIPALGMSIGQNVAVGYQSWRESVRKWYDEFRMYRYGFDPDSYLGPGGWRDIAHFTQIVQNGTTLVGCGYAECQNTQYIRYYVCNYASGQSNLAHPYTAGSRCGRCPNNCVNGLCDCGDRVCLNKGVMDLNTCTCSCPKLYKGATCEILDCPAEDIWICGRDWPVDYCQAFTNVPEECPYMCGLCQGSSNSAGGQNMINATQTFTSAHGCTYTGKRSSQAECRSYGNGGDDMVMCASRGGTIGCDQCTRYYNIKRDYCPVQCGICDAPCGGKQCLNAGTLDTATCSCSCRHPFQGDSCEYAACSVNGDPDHCRLWPQRYCKLYFNVPEECPYKCGICRPTSMPVPSNSTTTL